jgi:hypothetical protein
MAKSCFEYGTNIELRRCSSRIDVLANRNVTTAGRISEPARFNRITVEALPLFRVACGGLWLEKRQSVASLTLSGYSSVDITLLGHIGRVEGKRGLLI